MPQQVATSIENNFIGGLKTEFTGLNFPENACTDVDNCVFSLIGDVLRREGIDFEDNYLGTQIDWSNASSATYKWNNVGGDGNTQILVVQIGRTLYFFKSSDSTTSSPLSRTALSSTIDLNAFVPSGGTPPDSTECQFADGNGYLFVFNTNIDPVYCTYDSGSGNVTGYSIPIEIRDFMGVPEPGVLVTSRPTTLSIEHNYNLLNQGWNSNPTWSATDTSGTVHIATGDTGNKAFTVASGLTIVNGTSVRIYGTDPGYSSGALVNILLAIGTVTSYSSTTLTINISSATDAYLVGNWPTYNITPVNVGFLTTWHSDLTSYPSNGDVWWRYKNSSEVFDPGTLVNATTINSGPAPKGYYILSAFAQNRSYISGISGISNIVTTTRPKTGCWHQGRIFYAGVDASQQATGDMSYYTWTENIYFSQTIVDYTQFGMCYSVNDPTSEDLFDLLPTDGGVINIQGSGSIYKLFPIQNGILVFATNGIWFITGSQGIGFSANDYTVTKISAVQTLSHSSFVDVLGYPVFWNEEGIYLVTPGKDQVPYGHGGLVVENICLGTILSYYNSIPVISKRYARGDYNPITFVISWLFKSTSETGLTDRYGFDKILSLNTANRAFYIYTVPNQNPHIQDIKYISYPGGSSAPLSDFKYLTAYFTAGPVQYLTFADEWDDTDWVDFKTFDNVGVDYDSYFVTGYKLHGKALFKWQPQYVYVYSKTDEPTSYTIQALWDYANNRSSGRWSTPQLGTSNFTNYDNMVRRFKLRGNGRALQLKVNSISGKPFKILGWAMYETINAGV